MASSSQSTKPPRSHRSEIEIRDLPPQSETSAGLRGGFVPVANGGSSAFGMIEVCKIPVPYGTGFAIPYPNLSTSASTPKTEAKDSHVSGSKIPGRSVVPLSMGGETAG